MVDEIDSQMRRHFTVKQEQRFKSGPLTGTKRMSTEQFARDMDNDMDRAAGAAKAAGDASVGRACVSSRSKACSGSTCMILVQAG